MILNKGFKCVITRVCRMKTQFQPELIPQHGVLEVAGPDLLATCQRLERDGAIIEAMSMAGVSGWRLRFYWPAGPLANPRSISPTTAPHYM